MNTIENDKKEERQKRLLEKIARFRLFDDDFMTKVFEHDLKLTEFLLSIILQRKDLEVIESNTQVVQKSLTGRSVKFVHNVGGNRVEFSMESESDGTHRLFQLLEILLCKKEKVYIIDEINRSLHPKLTMQFVKKFFSTTQGRRIQLITSSHESRIMSHDIVRRDEIWIADKNADDSTKLFSLEEKQVRIDRVLSETYMDNVWGGVPVFLDEDEKNDKDE